MIKVNKIFIGAIASAALLAGCKTTPKAPPGPLKVAYSKAPYAAPRLKETPTEVRIVRREETSAAVAAQVGVHLLMAALGGGAAINTFNKEDLKGVPIEDVVDRQYLNNPVPTSFVQSLQEAVDASIADNPWAQQKSFSYPLVVGGGSAQLIYDNLMGTDDANYQLVLDLDVSKKREAGKRKTPPRCPVQRPLRARATFGLLGRRLLPQRAARAEPHVGRLPSQGAGGSAQPVRAVNP
ncbi:hypothetical protein [Comamonas koreensis]|uniref:Uncharacterized protein n=1 Tax=Comamonas koreensis TaxID=160825 RepID=A0AAW4XV04_9BURK|nr:hypothetical protein [Comamonas koreensis]MCD2165354.1 hypothetical protein [Comamonas koreensis]